MNTLLLNGSGIKDPTAYAAMVNLKDTEGDNDMCTGTPKPGEIWEVEIGATSKDMLVLATFDREFSTMVQIHEGNKNMGRAVEVTCTDGVKYADCEKLSFKYHENFLEYKKTIPDSVLEEIKRAVAEATGLTRETKTNPTSSELETERNKYKEECEKLREQLTAVKPADNTVMLTRAIKAEAERDVYKTLYTDAIRGKLL